MPMNFGSIKHPAARAINRAWNIDAASQSGKALIFQRNHMRWKIVLRRARPVAWALHRC
jgi:hypothetical protein